MMPNRFSRIAFIFASLAASPALALDAFWHGVIDTKWEQGLLENDSNWYDQAPPNGIAVGVPDGTATFTDDPANAVVEVSDERAIKTMAFPGARTRYVIKIKRGGDLTVNGTGLSTTTVTPRIDVERQGTLTFAAKANLMPNVAGGIVPAKFVIDGKVDISSKAGASEIVVDQGELNFKGKGSAEVSVITVKNGGSVFFLTRSDGDRAEISVKTGGTLDMSQTAGPTNNNTLAVKTVTNDGTFRIGRNRVNHADAFTQTAKGVLSLSLLPRGRGQLVVTGNAAIDGELRLSGHAGLKAGDRFTIITAAGIAGAFDEVTEVNFPKDRTALARRIGNTIRVDIR